MVSVAAELKLEREKRNISLAQIAEDTHISKRHLESLEAGRYADLPGGIYNRAFLRAYCESLDLDQRDFLRRYEQEMAPLTEKHPKSRVQIPPENTSQKIHPVIIWSIIILIIAIGLFAGRKWFSTVLSPYFSRAPKKSVHTEQQKQQPFSPAPVIQLNSGEKGPSVFSPTPLAPSKTQIPAGEIPAGNAPPATSPVAAKPAAMRLELVSTDKCWVSINRDGNFALRKVLEPGEMQAFDAEDKFWIEIGNAGGIQLKINGKPLKQLGLPGEVKRLLIDKKTLPDLLDANAG